SSPPTAAASRNMSACSWQAVSQVGWRLMVASSAKISRPRAPAAVDGARLFTCARKASISERVETAAGARPVGGRSVGSFAIVQASRRRNLIGGNSAAHKVVLSRSQRNPVGWVERSETHLTLPRCKRMGFAIAREDGRKRPYGAQPILRIDNVVDLERAL